MAAERKREDRLFVRDGRRSYRRRYSRAEARWGLGVLAVLAAVAAWVAWRGAHPDPDLFGATPELEPRRSGAARRGVLPGGLAAPGWREGGIAEFDAGNLYEKIDGREDYYKAFGFERLHFVTLELESDAGVVVDVEFFDLGSAANALGAYAGERGRDVVPRVTATGLSHRARNALFMTRGRYYVRAIGSEESERVTAQLEHLWTILDAGLDAEPLPWSFALFVVEMGLDPGRVAYMAENAFSFGFARDVHVAALEDSSEIFVVAAPDAGAARALAARFVDGFLEYGERLESGGGSAWVRDRYLGTVAGASGHGAWVTGVRAAPGAGRARAALRRLQEALDKLPADVAGRAGALAPGAEGEGRDHAGEAQATEPSYGGPP